MKPLNLAIFTDSFTPQKNGIVTSEMLLIKGLVKMGYRITVVAPHFKNITEFEYDNVEVIRVKGISANFYEGFKWINPINPFLIKKMKHRNIDLIHFMTPIGTGYMGVMIARTLKVPLVGTYHTFIADPKYLKQWILPGGSFSQKITWEYTKLFYNAANLVTAPSQSMCDLLIKNKIVGDIRAVSNGIDLSAFKSVDVKPLKEKYKLKEKVVAYLGRVSYEKNVHLFLPILRTLHKIDPEIQLLIIGDGPYRNEFEQELSKEGLSEVVIFTGMLDHDYIVSSGILGVAQIYLSMSDTETQSISLLESKAMGLVGVVAAALGHNDLIQNEIDGYLIPPSDTDLATEAILSLFSNPDLLKSMKKKSLESIKKHDKQNVIETWDAIYNDLVERKEKPFYTSVRALSSWIKKGIPSTKSDSHDDSTE